jgi:SprT-like family
VKKGRPLSSLFAELNRSHFAGELHDYRIITVRTNRRRLMTHHGETGIQGGYCKPRLRVIALWEGLRPAFVRKALLHEMCHAASESEMFAGFEHGPCWRSEMLRLALDHGETWAASEALRYARESDAVREAEYIAALEQSREAIRAWAEQVRSSR